MSWSAEDEEHLARAVAAQLAQLRAAGITPDELDRLQRIQVIETELQAVLDWRLGIGVRPGFVRAGFDPAQCFRCAGTGRATVAGLAQWSRACPVCLGNELARMFADLRQMAE